MSSATNTTSATRNPDIAVGYLRGSLESGKPKCATTLRWASWLENPWLESSLRFQIGWSILLQLTIAMTSIAIRATLVTSTPATAVRLPTNTQAFVCLSINTQAFVCLSINTQAFVVRLATDTLGLTVHRILKSCGLPFCLEKENKCKNVRCDDHYKCDPKSGYCGKLNNSFQSMKKQNVHTTVLRSRMTITADDSAIIDTKIYIACRSLIEPSLSSCKCHKNTLHYSAKWQKMTAFKIDAF